MITTDVERCVQALRQGSLVAVPTETVYGLAAVASDETAIRKVFIRKGRPFFDPLIVHVAELSQLDGVVHGLSDLERRLLETFSPGPLSLITKKSSNVSDLITAGHPSVAVRIPAHPVAQELLRSLGEPVVAPSANLFGRTSPTTAAHVEVDFSELLVLDGGECPIGIESTIVEVNERGEILILRPGGVSRALLEGLGVKVVREVKPVAPGHLKHHYQPRNPLRVVSEGGEINGFEIKLPDTPELAARVLYARLREGDRQEQDLYLRWNFPREGEWEAIWDRVSRAAESIEL
jgi:L-threonylcarbamoyladenylate synthase